VLAVHPSAFLVGVDASSEMLGYAARRSWPNVCNCSSLEDPLPTGPFDVVVTALAVHHLDGSPKPDHFQRAAWVLSAGGRFVLGDVVVPDTPPTR
jgi:tRNA (cmo5U34)-methyltransferase